jgi:hypothetical protein
MGIIWSLCGFFLSIAWDKSAKVTESQKGHEMKTGQIHEMPNLIAQNHSSY